LGPILIDWARSSLIGSIAKIGPILVSARFDKIDRNCCKKISKTAISRIFAKCPRMLDGLYFIVCHDSHLVISKQHTQKSAADLDNLHSAFQHLDSSHPVAINTDEAMAYVKSKLFPDPPTNNNFPLPTEKATSPPGFHQNLLPDDDKFILAVR
jgi:hypothetical protein